MWEPASSVFIQFPSPASPCAEDMNVMVKALQPVLVIINNSSLHSYILFKNDSCMVTPTQVPIQIDSRRRMMWNMRDPTFFRTISKFFGINRPFQTLSTFPLPHMQIRITIFSLEVQHFLLQNLWKPRVISPRNLLHNRVFWRRKDKTLVSIVTFQLRIKRRPDLRPFLTDRRNKNFP